MIPFRDEWSLFCNVSSQDTVLFATSSILCYIYIYIYNIYIYIYIYIYVVFTTEGFFDIAIESWPEWDI